MIRAVDSKRLDLTDSEFEYYQSLVSTFGEEEFRGLFETNRNGEITSICPPLDKQISMGVMFFMLNVMMNQRLRALNGSIKNKEENVATKIDVHNMQEKIMELDARIKSLEEKDLKHE